MTLLANPDYRRKAQQLQAELGRHDAPREAAILLERLAETKQPVGAPIQAGVFALS